MQEPALDIKGLEKSYPYGFLHLRRRRALGPLDLRLERGEVFGYLGPNGAGKTTTLKLLMGFIRRDAGTIRVLGRDWSDASWRSVVGYLPEHPYFYDYLTAAEYLEYAGRLLGLTAEQKARAPRLLDRVGLARVAGRPLRRFSKGMLQRLGLAQALLGDPQMLILDEPMSGLDPLGRRLVRDLILEQKDLARTVLFSTHILGDAEALCDRVGLVRDGQLVGYGRLDEILRVDVSHLEVLVSGAPEALLTRTDVPWRAPRRSGERWRLEVPEDRLVPALEQVVGAGGRVLSVAPVRQSLEDLFVSQVASGRPQDVVDE